MNAQPSPIEHAAVLIDACQDDVQAARGQARINYLYAQTDADAVYWFNVLQALSVRDAAQA